MFLFMLLFHCLVSCQFCSLNSLNMYPWQPDAFFVCTWQLCSRSWCCACSWSRAARSRCFSSAGTAESGWSRRERADWVICNSWACWACSCWSSACGTRPTAELSFRVTSRMLQRECDRQKDFNLQPFCVRHDSALWLWVQRISQIWKRYSWASPVWLLQRGQKGVYLVLCVLQIFHCLCLENGDERISRG